MIPFVLPNVFAIAAQCSRDEYQQHLHVHLKRAMKLDEPWQILLILIQNIETFLKLASNDDIKADVLPLLNRALESNIQEIQELGLAIVPTFPDFVDAKTVRSAFLPRIKKLCLDTRSPAIKVNCFVCIGKLLPTMDKWTVSDDILPFLTQIKTRDAAVMMGILGILKLVLDNDKMGMTKEVICNKIIPFLMPLCIVSDLSLSQFNTLMALIRKMVEQVDTEQRGKLHQFNAIQQTAKLPNMLTSPSAVAKSSADELMGSGVTASTTTTPSGATVKAENLYTTNMKQLADLDNWAIDSNFNATPTVTTTTKIAAAVVAVRPAVGPLVLSQPNFANFGGNAAAPLNNNRFGQLPSMTQPTKAPAAMMTMNSMMFSSPPTGSGGLTTTTTKSTNSSSLLLPMNNQSRNSANSKLLTKDIKLSDQDILDFLS